MQEFNIGDIVRLKDNDSILFMVVDVADFTEPSKHGEKPVIDIDCELMQVYPILKNAKYTTVSQNDIDSHARRESKDSEILLRLIQKDRERNGWYGVPDFIEVANNNMKAIHKSNQKTNVKQVKMPMKRLDVVRYDLIDNVDECLDAINDLNLLYEMFGDESYLQLKELVVSRLIRLQK